MGFIRWYIICMFLMFLMVACDVADEAQRPSRCSVCAFTTALQAQFHNSGICVVLTFVPSPFKIVVLQVTGR